MSTSTSVYQAPRLSSRPFSISGSKGPFFHFLRSVQKTLPCLLKVPPLGFGYPSDGVSSLNPGRLLSAPNALGLCPSELFSSKMAQMRSPSLVPLLRLRQTVQPVQPALQRCQLISKAVSPFLRPGGLARVGTLALLSFLASGALPPLRMDPRSLSSNLPSRLFPDCNLTITARQDLRVCHRSGLAFSPRGGRRPLWPFSPTVARYLFEA
jgi:hypothetical protein